MGIIWSKEKENGYQFNGEEFVKRIQERNVN